MLTVVIILSLISLLVATEAEPASSAVELRKKAPLRPGETPTRGEKPKSDRIAA